MSGDDTFKSSVRAAGDLAGVFEFEADAAYFYLYETTGAQGSKIVAAIRILSGTPDFASDDVEVRWDRGENIVGLLIRSQLWAAFDCRTNEKFGGDYRPGATASIPTPIVRAFDC